MRSKVYRFILCLFIFFSGKAIFSQHILTGIVYDETGTPLENAEVYLKETGNRSITDKAGTFKLLNIEKGAYTVLAYGYSYKIQKKNVEIISDVTIDFQLELLGEQLSEVVLSQRRKEIFGLQQLKPVEGTAIYAGKKSEVVLLDNTLGNIAANNARQIYAQVVGLNIYESSAGGLQLNIGGRGLDPNRTANFNTRQNGYDISADVLGYPESYYTPPPEALEKIEIVRGAASLQYGTQFGGLINFKMKRPVLSKPLEITTRQSLGSFGLFTSFTSLSGTLGKFSYYTYYHYKTGNTFRENSKFNSHNVFGHLEYAFSDRTSLSLDITYLDYLAQQPGGLTDTQFNNNPEFSNRTRNWFKVNWQLYSLQFKHQLTEKTDFSLNLFALDAQRQAVGFRGVPGNLNSNPIFVDDEQDFEGNFVNPRDIIDNTFSNYGAEARLLTRYMVFNKKAVFLIGSKYYKADNTARQGAGSLGTDADFSFRTNEFPSYPNQSDFTFPNQNIAFFIENIFNLTDNFSITPGLRFENIQTSSRGLFSEVIFDNANNPELIGFRRDDRDLDRTFLLAGVGLSYNATDSREYYANVSQNYRSVTFNDIRIVNPSSIVNELISDEKGGTADIGVRGKIGKNLSYDINVFGLLYADRIGEFTNNRAARERTNIGDAFIYGLESFVDWNLANLIFPENPQYRLSVFLNAAITQSEYTSVNNNVNSNQIVEGNKVEFIPRYNVKSGINGGYGNFLASIQFTYLSEQFTDATNSKLSAPETLEEGIKGIIPSYSVVDVSLSYTYRKWKLETGIGNLFDSSYFTQRATGYPGPGILPSAPFNWFATLQFTW
ncbi:TonB-dependent receptor [Aquimarina sp. ERC-38]|uniref:TonB-dependent receptor n=1 Tax=Aquimarina sp. ERC-38 TaxID=2949996 RepID=UPI002245C54C|nr:TonB-dependent receptor [Aquimarina sp. ERC-38]UZO80428.1 TonB-dependent receptor [Aquimarina sp. ERC-38]